MDELIVEVVKYGASRGSALAIAGHSAAMGGSLAGSASISGGLSWAVLSICM
jgi:hypothetical protein